MRSGYKQAIRNGALAVMLATGLDMRSNTPPNLEAKLSSKDVEAHRLVFGAPSENSLLNANGDFLVYAGIDRNGNGKYEPELGDKKLISHGGNFYKDDIICMLGDVTKYRGHRIEWFLVDERAGGQIVLLGANDWRNVKEDFKGVNGYTVLSHFPIVEYHKSRKEEERKVMEKVVKLEEEIRKTEDEGKKEELIRKKKAGEQIVENIRLTIKGTRIYKLGFFVDRDPKDKNPLPEYSTIFFIHHGKIDPR